MTSIETTILTVARCLSADLKILEIALEVRRKYRRGEASASDVRAAELSTRMRKTIIELGGGDDANQGN